MQCPCANKKTRRTLFCATHVRRVSRSHVRRIAVLSVNLKAAETLRHPAAGRMSTKRLMPQGNC